MEPQQGYDPSIFNNVDSIDQAAVVILTPDNCLSSPHRWRAEAPYLMKLMAPYIRRGSCVLDYGCGVGRLAKPLIEQFDCTVIGVDISAKMRALAMTNVGSDRFFALHPEMLFCLDTDICDFALAVWALQHVYDLRAELARIESTMAAGSKLFVVNNFERAVPTAEGPWIDDGIDVRAVLGDYFTEIQSGQLEGDEVAPGGSWLAENTFWAVYQK